MNITATFFLQVGRVALNFGLNILLTNFLGIEAFGIYSYAISWVTFLSILVIAGMDKLLTREISIAFAERNYSLFKGLLIWTLRITIVSSLATIFVAFVVITLMNNDWQAQLPYYAAFFILPFVVFNRLRDSVLQGVKHSALGNLPENFIQPIIFIVVVLIFHFAVEDNFGSLTALLMHLGSVVIAFMAGTYFMNQKLPFAFKEIAANIDGTHWKKSIIPLAFISAMYDLNARADAILLGMLDTTDAVGIYNVTIRLATLLLFVLTAVNKTVAADFSKLFKQGNFEKLQALATKSSRVITLFSIPVLLVLIVGGRYLLSFFGEEFMEGYEALVLLSIGQFFNAIVGSVGILLMMTGNEKIAARNVGISALVNVVLNCILIPLYSINGAAIATMISTILLNYLQMVAVSKRLRIDSTPLGRNLKKNDN